MDGAASTLIAVLGTLLGSAVAYLFQRKSADRNESFAHRQQLRSERMAVYSDFAGAVTEYRSRQYDRWHRRNEDPDSAAAGEARQESYRIKGVAQHELFRVRLIASSPALVEAARNAFETAARVHNASKHELRDHGDAAKEALQDFIVLASRDVQ